MGEEKPTRVGVVGGGLAGLSAALRAAELGARVEVFEAEPFIGGMAASHVFDQGYVFDIGPHSFYPRRPDVTSFFQELLGDNILSVDIRGAIYRDNQLYRYPWSVTDFVQKARFGTALAYLSSYIGARIRLTFHGSGKQDNFEEWCVRRFGRKFFQFFLSSHILKSYGIPAAQLPGVWAAQRIHVPSIVESIGDLISLSPRVGKAYYPRGGIGALPLALGQRAIDAGVIIHRNASVMQIQLSELEVELSIHMREEGRVLKGHFDSVVTTAALTETMEVMIPLAPRRIQAIASRLRSRSAIFVFIEADVAPVMGFTLCYFPMNDYSFIRLYEPRQYSVESVPQGRSSLCAEIHCDFDDEIWRLRDDVLADRILAELSTIPFVPSHANLRTLGVRRLRYHYPLPLVDNEELIELEGYLSKLAPRLVTSGRVGSFRYINMDDAILMGRAAADAIFGTKTMSDVLAVAARTSFIETGKRSRPRV